MKYSILVLAGDGIGPEVVAEGIKCLTAIAQRFGHEFEFRHALIGGAAIDAEGAPLSEATLALAKQSDAVLLGAVGGPKWSDPSAQVRPEQGLLAIRKALGLFANLRPVKPSMATLHLAPLKPEYLAGVDMLVVRELTGGIYFGEKTRTADRASDLCSYTVAEIERIVRMAAEFARKRRGKLAQVDKANVLETSRLWREVTNRIMATEYPDVQLEHVLVDSAAMHLLSKPASFDVIVTENMFGDILTDEASMLAGSLGLLPSASLALASGERQLGLYEPIHGSAPDIAGKGIANPIATIASCALLLRYSLKLEGEAQVIEAAIEQALANAELTPDLGGKASTQEMGQAIAAAIASV